MPKKNKPIRLVGQPEKKAEVKQEKKEIEEKKATDPWDAMPNTVEDPLAVFKMCLYEERCQGLEFRKAAVLAQMDNEIRNLQMARNNKMLELDRALRQAHAQMMQHKDHIEDKHKLVLKCYTYDDETGILTKQSEVKEDNG